MSTVLWANHLLTTGEVASDKVDRWALYKHAGKLDALARRANLEPFSGLLDHTDFRVNAGDGELPDGMESTNELMARDGVWKSAGDALAVLEGLLAAVTVQKPRFGVFRNDYDAVVAELADSVAYAKAAGAVGARFNFAVVM